MKSVYSYEKMRYGLFVHYVAGQAYYKDGTRVIDINECTDGFDVLRFAEEVASMGVEYLIFTAWHARAIPLYPSEVIAKWRPDKVIKRDLVGEIIDAVRERGVKVILYTHPRDGHDFEDEDRINCGWGEGYYVEPEKDGVSPRAWFDMTAKELKDSPNPDTFDYETWNQYTMEMYEELIRRYGSRIEGIWTDGNGPGRFTYASHISDPYRYPVVNYAQLRQLVKGINPDLVIVQNSFGYLFSDDYEMSESFFGFEYSHKDINDWPACEKAIALCFSSAGWSPSKAYGDTEILIDLIGMTKYLIFQATSASAGGCCLAAGPYCDGGWDEGVLEYLQEMGKNLVPLGESVKNIVPSTSWPTISGDSMKSKGYIAACSSYDKVYEYIHVLKLPEDGMVRLPASADGALISNPCPITAGTKVSEFIQSSKGVSFRVEGDPGAIDLVIRFRRENNPDSPVWYWMNDNDKRIRYKNPEEWSYNCLKALRDGTEMIEYAGCYEADTRSTITPGARFDTWFEGDEIELIVSMGPEGGVADVLLDDNCMATINTYADTRQNRVAVYTSGKLYGGYHTFSVVLKEGQLEFDALHIRK